ncbi:hypothetical protein BDB01DRAFT_878304 [Pilobolus umbonatus]|nr:hypothetical protein BDB01DRAFT_878304 [Pilobolus umbonatus]
MPNKNEISIIITIATLFLLILSSIFYIMNKASVKRRRTIDLEYQLKLQQKMTSQYLFDHSDLHPYPPVFMRNKAQSFLPPILPEKRIHKSILRKIYGYRKLSSSPPPIPHLIDPTRPSHIRAHRFIPMQERAYPSDEPKRSSLPSYESLMSSIIHIHK